MPIPNKIRQLLDSKKNVPARLELGGHSLHDEDMLELLSLISQNPIVQSIDLSDNIIGEDAADTLINFPVEYLSVSGTYIGDAGAGKLLTSQHLTSLSLSSCALSDKIEQTVLQNKKIIHLDIADNPSISDRTHSVIEAHIKENRRIAAEKTKEEKEHSEAYVNESQKIISALVTTILSLLIVKKRKYLMSYVLAFKV